MERKPTLFERIKIGLYFLKQGVISKLIGDEDDAELMFRISSMTFKGELKVKDKKKN